MSTILETDGCSDVKRVVWNTLLTYFTCLYYRSDYLQIHFKTCRGGTNELKRVGCEGVLNLEHDKIAFIYDRKRNIHS